MIDVSVFFQRRPICGEHPVNVNEIGPVLRYSLKRHLQMLTLLSVYHYHYLCNFGCWFIKLNDPSK